MQKRFDVQVLLFKKDRCSSFDRQSNHIGKGRGVNGRHQASEPMRAFGPIGASLLQHSHQSEHHLFYQKPTFNVLVVTLVYSH